MGRLIPLAALAVALAVAGMGCTEHPESCRSPGEAVLLAYLMGRRPAAEQSLQAAAIVATAREVWVEYERPTPERDDADRKEVMAFAESFRAIVEYPTVKTTHRSATDRYPGLSFVFRRRLRPEASPLEWLREMRRPVEHGFLPQRVDVIHEPTPSEDRRIASLCDVVARQIVAELNGMKREFPQLAGLTMDSYENERRDSSGGYGGITFPRRRAPQSEGGSTAPEERPPPDTMAIGVGFGRLEGRDSGPLLFRVRRFPHLGLVVRWHVSADDAELTRKAERAIKEALTPLNEYEAQLSLFQ